MKYTIFLLFTVFIYSAFGMENPESNSLVLPNYIGKIPKDFELFGLTIQRRKELKEKGIELPCTILIAGESDTGKTFLVQELAKAVDAYLELSDMPPLDNDIRTQVATCVSYYQDSVLKTQSNGKDILFLFIDIGTSTFFGQTKEALTQKVRATSNVDSFIFVEIPEAKSNHYQIFDTVISIPMPDEYDRKAFFDHYSSYIKTEFEPGCYNSIKYKTMDFTAPLFKKLVNNAALQAYMQNSPSISEAHMQEALETIKPKKFARTLSYYS